MGVLAIGKLLIVTVIITCSPLSAAIALPQVAPRVTLDSGIYEGLTTSIPGSPITVHKFLGVRFGVVPKRFDPAVLPEVSTDEIKAVEDPPACIQAKRTKEKESEDCLFMNIYAPEPNGENDRAVMIFLYGGGFMEGSASLAMYDGSSFAANQDVVVVVPNYRTNVFGFPGEAPGHPEEHRNLGLLDQHLAFRFVQKHISKFGGDPSKVTLFGQSAGARAADFHLLTMKEKSPFRAVIMESGSSELTPLADFRHAYKNTSTENPFMRLCREVGCPTPHASIECMRQKPAQVLKDAIIEANLHFGSVYDGNVTTVLDQAVIRQNRLAANVSLLLGTNADEQKAFVKAGESDTLYDYSAKVFGDRPTRDKARDLYKVGPQANFASDVDAIAALETDYAYTCLTSREANISSLAGYPTWRYFFNFSSPNIARFPGSGAYHGAEIRFVFGNLLAPTGSLLPEEISLSKTMQKTWADFAKDPLKGPGWPRVGTAEKDIGYFGHNGELSLVGRQSVDRNCNIFRKMYPGRA